MAISKVSLGQTAVITVNALNGESFEGVVTQIGADGTSDGGNSKFTVELTLVRSGDMLNGMNATAVFTLDTAQSVLSVPAAALNEDGSETCTPAMTRKPGSLEIRSL